MGYHSLIFQDSANNVRHTWNNWHLIPSSRPTVIQPNINLKYVEVPGMDGSLDLSDFLMGRPTYSDRSGTFEFIVDNGYGNWVDRKMEIAKFLDGRRMRMTMEDDPNFYYMGRFYMSNWESGANFSTVSIQYQIDPYKYRTHDGSRVIG